MGTAAMQQAVNSGIPMPQQASTKPMPLIDETTSRLESALADLEQLTVIVREFVDGTKGIEPPSPNVPQSAGPTGLGPANGLPRGEILRLRVDMLVRQIGYLRTQIIRIHNI